MKHYKETDRTASLLRLVPGLFSTRYKSVLYIGARSDRFDYGDEFKHFNYKITILEAWEDNVEYLRTEMPTIEVIHGEVQNVTIEEKFDVVFWWHGPEHVPEDQLSDTINKIEKWAKKVVIMGCPWGHRRQKAIQGNPYERHVSHLLYPFFEEKGYTVECLGVKNGGTSHITAVKYVG